MAFNNHKKHSKMPLTDADKDTKQLLQELKDGISPLLTALIAKVTELQYREVKNGDADDTPALRGGTRPYHSPHV